MCLALREIIEEEKANIIKDSERKINESVNNGILLNNIQLVREGYLPSEKAAQMCGLTLVEFLEKKEEYESSAVA